MQDCKPIKTPTAMNFKKELYSAGGLLNESDKQLDRNIVVSLMSAMIGARPDIAFATGELSKFVSKPSQKHLIAAKRVIRYFKFTKYYHLRYSRGRLGESFELCGYCDPSWGYPDDGNTVCR
jgi:hypothetical protein